MKITGFFTAFLLLSAGQSVAQSDSVRVDYSVENADTARRTLRETFRYLTRATVEKKTLLKTGLTAPVPLYAGYNGLYYGAGIELGVERKLSPSFSVQGLLMNRYYRYGSTYQAYSYTLEMPVSIRYYYSAKRRIRNGRSANNFSNNYFGLQAETILYGYGNFVKSSMTSGNYTVTEYERIVTTNPAFLAALSLQWGIQRRLGKRGYFDVNLTIPVHPFLTQSRFPNFIRLPVSVNFRLGLGW